MWSRAAVVACAALQLVHFASADHDLVFPFVGMGEAGEDSDEWADFQGQVMNVADGLTTYSVGCAKETCAGWSNVPDFTYTMVIASNTFDFQYTDMPVVSTHSACTFIGTPATSASCEETNSGVIGHSTMGYEHHNTYPDYTGIYNVMSATLKIVDGTAAASATSGASTGGSAASVTPAPTTTASSKGTAKASGSNATGSSASAASTGGAQRTAAPWVLGAGMAAGVVLGF